MAEQLYFSRDSKLYAGFDNKVWEVPILDGFSFSQSTNQSEIGLAEMQGTDGLSRRGQRVFTDSLAPAEWSFSTYVRPYRTATDSGESRAVEEVLWAIMAGADKYQDGTDAAGGLIQGNITITTAGTSTTAGTYIVTNSTTGIGGTKGVGAVGWEIELTVGGSGITAVTVIDSGEGFSVGDTITIPTSVIGGSATATLTVATAVTGAVGGIASVAAANNTGRTANKTYSIKNGDTGVTVKTAGGATVTDRVGWELDLTAAANGTITAVVASPGSGFVANDTIEINNNNVGGSGGVLTFTVTISTISSTFYRLSQPDSASPFGPTVSRPVGTGDSGKTVINFGQSNRSTLGTCDLYFVMETSSANPMVYKLSGAAFNEASIDFEVDGIATINWSGFAANITDMQSSATAGSSVTVQSGKTISGNSSTGSAFAAGDVVLDSNDGLKLGICTANNAANFAIDDGVGSTKTFIRNRLTQLDITADTADRTAFPGVGGNGKYQLTLTGGNITITNNISYLVPEELGAVNVPIEHVTGTRSASGSFTCYLTLDDSSGQNGTSVELFNDMTTSGPGKGLEKVVNNFETTFSVGGTVANTPRLNVKFPKVHINVPTHSIEDVISLETTFASYTDDFNVANEVQLEYFGTAL
jgi:hypothetical protein